MAIPSTTRPVRRLWLFPCERLSVMTRPGYPRNTRSAFCSALPVSALGALARQPSSANAPITARDQPPPAAAGKSLAHKHCGHIHPGRHCSASGWSPSARSSSPDRRPIRSMPDDTAGTWSSFGMLAGIIITRSNRARRSCLPQASRRPSRMSRKDRRSEGWTVAAIDPDPASSFATAPTSTNCG